MCNNRMHLFLAQCWGLSLALDFISVCRINFRLCLPLFYLLLLFQNKNVWFIPGKIFNIFKNSILIQPKVWIFKNFKKYFRRRSISGTWQCSVWVLASCVVVWVIWEHHYLFIKSIPMLKSTDHQLHHSRFFWFRRKKCKKINMNLFKLVQTSSKTSLDFM